MRLTRLVFVILCGLLITIVTLAISNIPTITISSQAQLDSLHAAVIKGNLIINGPDISNLDSLYRLTSVKGFFEIRNNPSLTNINGLSHLDSITGNFEIQNNINLDNINGLSGLNFIGGGLKIDSNYALLSIDGLSRIDSVRGGLTIVNNPLLANINGLSNLKNIRGGLTIDSDYALLDIGGLSRIDSIGGSITIKHNLALKNIDGLSRIDSVRGGLTIVNNPLLANINGLSNLKNIRGGLTIDSEYALLDINGLSRIDSIGGSITIKHNLALKNIDGLSRIDSVRGGLTIVNNPALANINGLSNLKNIRGGLTIDSEYTLLDLNGLSRIDSIGGGISINHNLALKNVDGLSRIDSVRGGLTIGNNPALVDINGFSNLKSIRGGLRIDSNHALLNIDALSRVNFIGGGLTIDSNATLENLSGLSNLNSVKGNLTIQNNISLTEFCGLFNLLNSGGLSGTYNVTGNKNNPTQADIISGGTCTTPSSIYAVILGTNSIWFEATSQVHSGNIIVNDMGAGPVLDAGVELSIGVGVQTPAGYSVMANRIKVKAAAHVNGNVYYNQLSNHGYIAGSLNHPLSLPVYSVLPPFHQQTPGTQNITVQRNASVTLTAGDYQDVVVKTKGTLFFSGGGTFSIRNLNTENKVKLVFDKPTKVLISNRFDTDVNCYIGPNDGSSIDASDIIFYIAGINGNNGDLNSLPKSAQIGLNNNIFANFYVPNGTLWLTGLTDATGAFIAKDVRVGLNVDVYEKSAFEGSNAPKAAANNAARKSAQIVPLPETYMLLQNFPNPFNPSTTIKYALPENEKVIIDIYDLLGRKVAELINGEVDAGYHEVTFNASNLASGVYFYRLSAGSFTQVNKMLLMK